MSVVSYVKTHAETNPEKTAVIAENLTLSYGELWKNVRGFARYLQSFRLEKGARIVVKAFPTTDFPVVCFAIHLAGYTFVPIEKTMGLDGVKEVAENLAAAMVINDQPVAYDGAFVPTSEIRQRASDYFDESADFPMPEPADYCDILFTTGTTGKSKGVLLTHRAVTAAVENTLALDGLTDESVYLIASPVNHASGIRKIYATAMQGGTSVIVDGFMNIRRFYDALERYRADALLLPPSAARVLLTVSSAQLAKFADQVKVIHSATASFPEADKEALVRIFPHTRLIFAYGSSEAGCSCGYDYAAYPGLTNCVGKATPHARVFIVDDAHKPFQSSKEHVGLIAVESDALMTGYYNAPELTKDVAENGILYTNDIGYIDGDGFVFMLGRKGDVINVGGLKIAPTEVENVVMRFPGVTDCACFGIPDKVTGSAPKLNVVTTPAFDLAEFRKYLQTNLEMFKIPKVIEQVDSLPKTANGKLDRKNLH